MTEYSLPIWLPELVLFEDYQGNWERYLETIYVLFCDDFVRSKAVFKGRRLGLKRHPVIQGKEATFWHMVSEGSVEGDRLPDLRRCERIRWPKPVIEHDNAPEIKIWSEKKKGNKRIHIWFEAEGYLVVLDDRKDFILPWTAFYVKYDHQRRKYNKRWNSNKGNEI